MYPGGEVIGGVCREHRTFGLEDDGTFVVVFVHIMDGNAAFLFTGGDDCFMNMVAVHAFAAVGREKGRLCGVFACPKI